MAEAACCGHGFGWNDMKPLDGQSSMTTGKFKCQCKRCGKRWVMDYDSNGAPYVISFKEAKSFKLPKLSLEELDCIN